MSDFDAPDGWVVWNEGSEGRLVLAYRPDVFDADGFPAECLPTLYLTRGRRGTRPPGESSPAGADWHVTLYLEPDVDDGGERYGSREAALAGARERAAAFAAGEVDYRALYQVPREAYFDRLDELTGREA
ncbi:DUF5820 family protein [Halostella litorea]|uniref:DUF5820 family protein n=1 Tax=Halostella litorea TaxID=2528831 RepID=UPI001091AC81|nr:DUF5820 family protein [Halostella litorea]